MLNISSFKAAEQLSFFFLTQNYSSLNTVTAESSVIVSGSFSL